MKPNLLEIYQIKKYEDYSKLQCVNIVYEQTNVVEDKELSLLRGKYKGISLLKKSFS